MRSRRSGRARARGGRVATLPWPSTWTGSPSTGCGSCHWKRIKQNPKYHPEGDALYHSLQVFHLAREARPYDEEFLLAALLHDVGKAIDPQDHCERGRARRCAAP